MANGWTGALIAPLTTGDITLGSRAGLPQNFQPGVSTITPPRGPENTAAAATAGLTNNLRDTSLGSRSPEMRAQLANQILPTAGRPATTPTTAANQTLGIPDWLQQAVKGLNAFTNFAQPMQQPAPVAQAPVVLAPAANQPDPANLFRQQLLGQALGRLNYELSRPTQTELYGPTNMGAASLTVPNQFAYNPRLASLQNQVALLSGWTPSYGRNNFGGGGGVGDIGSLAFF